MMIVTTDGTGLSKRAVRVLTRRQLVDVKRKSLRHARVQLALSLARAVRPLRMVSWPCTGSA